LVKKGEGEEGKKEMDIGELSIVRLGKGGEVIE